LERQSQVMRTDDAVFHDIPHSFRDLLQRIVICVAKKCKKILECHGLLHWCNLWKSNNSKEGAPSWLWFVQSASLCAIDARDACAWNGCTHCFSLTKSMGRQAELHRGHCASPRGPPAATRRGFGAALFLFLGRQARLALLPPN
jgi:hypothetical protein